MGITLFAVDLSIKQEVYVRIALCEIILFTQEPILLSIQAPSFRYG